MTLYTRFDWLRWKMFTQIYILNVGRPTHRSSFLLTPSVRIKSVDLKRSLTPFFASCSYTTRKISEIPQDHTNSEICLQRLSKAEMDHHAAPGLGHKMLSPFFQDKLFHWQFSPFFNACFLFRPNSFLVLSVGILFPYRSSTSNIHKLKKYSAPETDGSVDDSLTHFVVEFQSYLPE